MFLAERGGFEPPDPVSQVNSLAVSPIRPLSHLSVSFKRSRPRPWPHAHSLNAYILAKGHVTIGSLYAEHRYSALRRP